MAGMITRSFVGTKCKALVYDNTAKETKEIDVYVNGHYDNDEKLNKAVEKNLKNSEYKFITVTQAVDATEVRGMTEQVFIQNSVLLNPETRKPM